MAYWLLKTEPSSYSFADLQQEGRTVWDGVRNAQALIHLRAMHAGDRALIYHSGAERAVVGTATIISEPYTDPQTGDTRHAVVEVRPDSPALRPVPLTTIRAEAVFATIALVRQPRLSVMPVTPEQWVRLLELMGLPGEA